MKLKEAAACALQRARLARRLPSCCARTESSHLQIGGQVFQDEVPGEIDQQVLHSAGSEMNAIQTKRSIPSSRYLVPEIRRGEQTAGCWQLPLQQPLASRSVT